MDRNKIIKQIKEEMAMSRQNAFNEYQEKLDNLCKDENFRSIYSSLSKNRLEYAKAKYTKSNCEIIENSIKILEKEILDYLTSHNLKNDYLKPKFNCKFCEDLGTIKGKPCSCFLKQLNERTNSANKQYQFSSFEDSNENFVNSNETLSKTYAIIRKWCANYPATPITNINLIGGSGTGKTFLLECIASKLMEKNINVHFTTSFTLNDECKNYHFSKDSAMNEYLNSKVLIIDDLGCEPLLKNITIEYLYNIINLRQKKNLATIISTNLDKNELLSRYEERIFSRLFFKQKSFTVTLLNNNIRYN